MIPVSKLNVNCSLKRFCAKLMCRSDNISPLTIASFSVLEGESGIVFSFTQVEDALCLSSLILAFLAGG